MTEDPARPLARLAEGVLMEAVGEEAVLMQLDRGLYYSLNVVGTRMLELARTEPDVGAVVRALADEYEADEEVLQHDLLGLLADLQSSGLIELLADRHAVDMAAASDDGG